MHDDLSADAVTVALLVAAQSGNAEAMYRLGSPSKSSGDRAGPAEAGAWWRQVAAAGHVEAMYRLGLLLENHDEELGRLLAGGEASHHLISHAVLNGLGVHTHAQAPSAQLHHPPRSGVWRRPTIRSRPCAGDSRTADSGRRG